MLKTQKDKASYAIGVSIGKSLKRDGIEVDPALLPARNEGRTRRRQTPADRRRSQGRVHRDPEGSARQAGSQNEECSAKPTRRKAKPSWPPTNPKRESSPCPADCSTRLKSRATAPSRSPPIRSSATIAARSSTARSLTAPTSAAQPATFPVSGVIKGWTEILQLMPVGSKYQVFVPADLAYGPRGAGADIGPESTP